MPFADYSPEDGMNRNFMLALVVILVAAAGFYLYGTHQDRSAGARISRRSART